MKGHALIHSGKWEGYDFFSKTFLKYSVQRNAFDIGIRVILPFSLRNFFLLLFLFPEEYVDVKHQKSLPEKTGNGF